MLTGHRWSVSHWKKYVLGHPILGHMARRLVWKLIAEGSGEALFFRPDEEGACVDVDFDDLELTEGGQIALLRDWLIPT